MPHLPLLSGSTLLVVRLARRLKVLYNIAMRFRYYLAGSLFTRCAISLATSVSPNNIQTRTTNSTNFVSFGKTVGLSESAIQNLGDKFAQISNPTTALAIACETAQILFGVAQVEATPVDQTVVDENW